MATVLGCDEFPASPTDGAGIATIALVSWPDSIVLATTDTAEIIITDEKGREVLGAAASWQGPPGGALALSAEAGVVNEVTGAALGRGVVIVRFQGGGLEAPQFQDTIHVVLGGVRLAGATGDTASVGAILDTLVVHATGVDGAGVSVESAGLVWSAGGDGIAVIETLPGADSARIIAIGEGQDVILVSNPACLGSCEDSLHFFVSPSATELTAAPIQGAVLVGDTVRLAAEGRDRNGSVVVGADVRWTTRDSSVAVVDSTGLLTAVDSGAVTVVGTAGLNARDSIEVVVRPTALLEILMTDAPSDYLEEAWIHWSGVFVQDTASVSGRRYVVRTAGQVDLLTLQQGATQSLGVGGVATGFVDRLSLEIDSAVVQLKSGFTFAEGGTSRVLLPAAGQADSVGVVIATAVPLSHTDTARVVVDFDVNRSFRLDQEPGPDGVIAGMNFLPTPRAVDFSRTGSILGMISAPGGGDPSAVTLRATRTGAADTLTTSTQVDGSYGFYFVEPGDYQIASLNVPQCFVLSPLTLNTTVPLGGAINGVDATLDSTEIASVSVVSSRDSLFAIGDSTTVSFTARDSLGAVIDGVDFILASSNQGVATVSPEGIVVANGNGTTQVTATSCGVSASSTLVVSQVAREVTFLTPANGALSLESGESFQLEAVVADSNGIAMPAAALDWSTSDPSVVSVSASGRVDAVGPGSAFVFAASGALADSVLASVLAPGLVERPVAAGGGFSCDVDAAGAAWCWGTNLYGQLGDGTTTNRTMPTRVSGGLPMRSVVAGDSYACGLSPAGAAYCWGRNNRGQLGDGTFQDRLTPTAVAGGNVFRDIDVGTSHTCGLTAQDEILCWGENNTGQLGRGSSGGVFADPGPITGPQGWSSLDVGGFNACAIASGGETYCWGRDVAPTQTPTPTAVSGGRMFSKVSVGAWHACATDGSGQVFCWGQGGAAMGPTQGRTPSAPLGGFQTWTDVFAGYGVTCGVAAGGNTYCWGENGTGKLGNGSLISFSEPQLMGSGEGFSTFAAGWSHACGRPEQGTTKCWGDRGEGALGDGLRAFEPLPQALDGAFAQQVSTGAGSGCMIRTSRLAACWGANEAGQLGDGSTTDRLSPVSVQLGVTLQDISVGTSHTCAVTDAGAAYCWGSGGSGRLGNGAGGSSTVPQVVTPVGSPWTRISSGGSHSCGLAADSRAYCWGANSRGQLGDGTNASRASPVPVTGGHLFVDIATSDNATCGLRDDGGLYCWGQMYSPVFGDGGVGAGTTSAESTPVEVGAGLGFQSISGGGSGLMCGIASDDSAYCWIDGYQGKIGDGASQYRATPAQVVGGYSFASLTAGSTHTCGVTTVGQVLCWGSNIWGQLGTGFSGSDASTPQAGGGGLSLTAVSPGLEMTCGIGTGSQLYCWGRRTRGRTGEGLDATALTPVWTAPR